jgi:hypothetical protein
MIPREYFLRKSDEQVHPLSNTINVNISENLTQSKIIDAIVSTKINSEDDQYYDSIFQFTYNPERQANYTIEHKQAPIMELARLAIYRNITGLKYLNDSSSLTIGIKDALGEFIGSTIDLAMIQMLSDAHYDPVTESLVLTFVTADQTTKTVHVPLTSFLTAQAIYDLTIS